MSKKYKGKICVYCADAISVTGDHVFAREFFLETQRDNLPQVPACEKYNNRKSVLEHYLTTVLPLEGTAVTQLFEFIARGLSWFHWGTIIKKTSIVSAMALTKTGVAFFQERFFALNAKARVENAVGDRAFSYTGAQALDTDRITVWLFETYAGLRMTDKDDIEDYSNIVGVITNPSSLEEKVASAFGLHRAT